jgi:peptide/nickel transport system substrate-binding protein
LPSEPLVVKPFDTIGKYGGVLRTISADPTSNAADAVTIHGSLSCLGYTPDLKTIVPNFVKGWNLSGDIRTLTLQMREGAEWSDGAPLTAEDALFWYDDILLDDQITPAKPSAWNPGGKLVRLSKIDDYTIRLDFADPYPVIVSLLAAGNNPFAPKHYLSRYHLKYNPKANELAKADNYDEWWQLFNYYATPGTNQVSRITDYPTYDPFFLKTVSTTYYTYERNPYFWKVDTEGNQLPYLDGINRTTVESRDVANIKVIAGEVDVAGFDLVLENYPLYKENESKGGYRTMLWGGPRGAEQYLVFNYTSKDPVLRQIFNDLRLRQALSVAINRKEINDTLFYGKGTPRQATANPTCSFYEDWMGQHYAEYDQAKANRLLDEMGLKWDSAKQFRLRTDGKSLALTVEYVELEGPKGRMLELIKDYWADVGVDLAIKQEERSYYQQRGLANEGDVRTWHLDWASEAVMHRLPHRFRPPWHNPNVVAGGREWWNWYDSKGKIGEEPPPVVKRLFAAVDEWQQTVPGTEEYMRLGKEILTINVENLFAIGTVGMTPVPVVVKNYVKNAPKEGMFGSDFRFFGHYQADQWYFDR